MTYTGKRPHVVHGPDHTLSAPKNIAHPIEREHGLVDPMKVNHIRFPELLETGYVVASPSGVNGEKSVAAETVAQEYFEPFNYEFCPPPYRGLERNDFSAAFRQRAVATKQLRVNTCLAKGAEQAQGGYGRPAGMVGSVYKKYFHGIVFSESDADTLSAFPIIAAWPAFFPLKALHNLRRRSGIVVNVACGSLPGFFQFLPVREQRCHGLREIIS